MDSNLSFAPSLRIGKKVRLAPMFTQKTLAHSRSRTHAVLHGFKVDRSKDFEFLRNPGSLRGSTPVPEAKGVRWSWILQLLVVSR